MSTNLSKVLLVVAGALAIGAVSPVPSALAQATRPQANVASLQCAKREVPFTASHSTGQARVAHAWISIGGGRPRRS
jgi:hypothetical protein